MWRSMTVAMTSTRRRGSRRRTLIFCWLPMKSCVFPSRAIRRAAPWPLARVHALSLSLALLPVAALAQSTPLPNGSAADPAAGTDGTPVLPETVVTATRVATPVNDLVSDTVVITRDQIEQQASRTLPEILARMAGVQIAANGGLGEASSVFIRGADASSTILLIDGVRYGSATLGTPVWDNIPVEMIDRIEVVKGPASALYGSDGVGGVVQIFTRRGSSSDPFFSPRASTTIGSDHYAQIGAGFSGASGAATYSLDVQRTTVNSFSATNPNVAFGNYNPDNDPFQQNAINASFGYQLNKDWKFSAGILNSTSINHYDDGPDLDTRASVRTEVGYLGVTGDLTPDWTTQLCYSHSEDYTRNIVAQSYNLPGLFETYENQYLWQNDFKTRIGTVVAGLESRDQNVRSDTQYTVTDRTINSAFVGLNGDSGAQSWQLNARHDSNSQFGDDNTWYAGYGLRLTPNWRVTVSQGTSFTAPSFNQLYYPDFGDPGLKPQTGRNTDASIAWSQGGQTVKLVGYYNKIDNFITTTTIAENIAYAKITGETLSYDGQFDKIGLHASYDWLDPRNEATGALLPRRSKEQATMSIDYTQGPWRFGGSALYVGSRFDDSANTVVLDSYTTIDAYVDYRWSKQWSVQGRITNLTNAHYETAYGYNQAGRGAYLTLRWQPG